MENLSEKLTRYQQDFVKLKMPIFPRSEQLKLDYEDIPEKMNAERMRKNSLKSMELATVQE
jgi:hypothetical protein